MEDKSAIHMSFKCINTIANKVFLIVIKNSRNFGFVIKVEIFEKI